MEYTSQVVTVDGFDSNEDGSYSLLGEDGMEYHTDKMEPLTLVALESFWLPLEDNEAKNPLAVKVEILCFQERCVTTTPTPETEKKNPVIDFFKFDEPNEQREMAIEMAFDVSLSSTDPHLSL